MRSEYQRLLQTESVERAQLERYGRINRVGAGSGEPIGLGTSEVSFLAERDSFYLASVNESGWPYVQHRGGEKGFLKVVDGRRLAFADLEGNRQLISVGNVASNDRVSLFAMDYRARERLKIAGRARVVSAAEEPEIASMLGVDSRFNGRIFIVEVVGFDWNCPKRITQRFTREEVEAAMQPLKARIAQLEAKRVGGGK